MIRLKAIRGTLVVLLSVASAAIGDRPNFLLAIADDWGWPHAGVYGDRAAQTPTFDRLAGEGTLYRHAYVSSPSCTPSRGALLTGQWHWRLGAGANLWSVFPDGEHVTYVDLLVDAGYQAGYRGKGWGPGRTASGRSLTGPRFKSFDAFLAERDAERPFVFWLGSGDPHRPYDPGSGVRDGIDVSEIDVPGFLPDAPEVRSDLADYYAEVERFDALVGKAIAALESAGLAERTVVVVTGDHGMPFPRCKSNLYDLGVRVPLAIRWGRWADEPGTRDDFVSLIDVGPTFLAMAGVDTPRVMNGRDLRSNASPPRNAILIGRERHVPAQEAPDQGGYPCRAIRTRDFLYVKNYRPDRWPAGTPNGAAATIPGRALGDCDAGPTRAYLIEHADEPGVHASYRLCFGKRPADELYDLRNDPEQLVNVAAEPQYAEQRQRLAERLEACLAETDDPRAGGPAVDFEAFEYLGNRGRKRAGTRTR